MIAFVFSIALATHAPDSAPAAAQMAVVPKPEKIERQDTVCKHEAVVGSRMPRRICTTQAEWIARRAHDRREVEKVQNIQPL